MKSTKPVRLSAVCLCLMLALGTIFSTVTSALAAPPAPNTRQDVLQKWDQTRINPYAPLYQTQPDIQNPNPAQPGRLTNEVLNGALDYTNFIRNISGLGGVTLNETYNYYSSMGSMVLYQLNSSERLSHTPARPSNMSYEDYEVGYYACSTSNLYWASWKMDSLQIVDSIYAYMSDSDSSNATVLGHRRWVLNPDMGQTGFGSVMGDRGTFCTMTAHDFNGKGPNPDYVAWPAAGDMPAQLFSEAHGMSVWSVSLNPSVYSPTQLNNVSVTLTRKSANGSTVTYPKFTNPSRNLATASTQYVYNICTQNYGVPYMIAFRPRDTYEIQPGDSYTVRIDGLTLASTGQKTSLEYKVNFFSLQGWQQKANGDWEYITDYVTHTRATNWKQIGGQFYLFGRDGTMYKNFQRVGGAWYFLGETGRMYTGWLQRDGVWYYFDGSGAMATGISRIGGNSYYFGGRDDGVMRTGWQQIEGKWYYFFLSSGVMATGWQLLDGNWYYFGNDGAMRVGNQTIGGVSYRFNLQGILID